MQRRKVTIKDVARESGFSVATVSDALNNKGRVAEKTRQKIQEIAKELNFTPNRIAKNLTTGRTGSIVLAVSPISSQETRNGVSDWDIDYYFRVLNGATSQSFKRGYLLSMIPFHEGFEVFLDSADGLIVVDPGDDDELLDYAIERRIHCVSIGRNTRHVSWVDNDFVRGTTEALNLLDGSKPALFLSETSSSYVRDELSAYLEWCMHNNTQPIILRSPSHRTEDAVKVIRQALSGKDRQFDAIVTTLDTLAQAADRSARELGLEVPKDFQIVSLSDSKYLDYGFQTPITALDLKPMLLGELAVDYLVDHIRGNQTTIRETIDTSLIIRDSTRKKN